MHLLLLQSTSIPPMCVTPNLWGAPPPLLVTAPRLLWAASFPQHDSLVGSVPSHCCVLKVLVKNAKSTDSQTLVGFSCQQVIDCCSRAGCASSLERDCPWWEACYSGSAYSGRWLGFHSKEQQRVLSTKRLASLFPSPFFLLLFSGPLVFYPGTLGSGVKRAHSLPAKLKT